MATLVFGAVGTLVGGPLGGALGALIGQQVDRAVIGTPSREGARLKELAVTTSSYGTPVGRHFGRMRTAGSIIWASDLKESSETSGGKGQPSTTTFSYSASFAVALSSRPIAQIGRIWADGNLLRGEAGDLKTGGTMRFYDGHGDHPVDPLIAADRGAHCPAFRNIAYVVFEDLQLGDFGSRIPALTFEVIADDTVALADIVDGLPGTQPHSRPLPDLLGFAHDGGSLAGTLDALNQVYPMHLDGGQEPGLTVKLLGQEADEPPILPLAAALQEEDTFAPQTGQQVRRAASPDQIATALRYYDTDRDYQAGLQRADGRARPGRERTMEFPGVLAAQTARNLVNASVERDASGREKLAWRTCTLDTGIGPGSIVRVPDRGGTWIVEEWEWRQGGIELSLFRHAAGPMRTPRADPGIIPPVADIVAPPTILHAFEAPAASLTDASSGEIRIASSAAGEGWSGAALYAQSGDSLVPIGPSGTQRSIIGSLASPLPSSPALVIERHGEVLVDLVASDFALAGASAEGLANGANRALIGSEVVQFASASRVAGNRWRLRGLLRGRGGTEPAALRGASTGTPFVLLDARPTIVPKSSVPETSVFAALGRGDAGPAYATLANPGLSSRPLAPVHGRWRETEDGALELSWLRRERGAWIWTDGGDLPLRETSERYRVGVGDVLAPQVSWTVQQPRLDIAASTLADLRSAYSGQSVWVRQLGDHGQSDPLLLFTL